MSGGDQEPVTRGDVRLLAGSVDLLTAKFKWQVRLTVGLVIALVLVVLALAGASVALVQLRQEARCTAGLAAASADRTGVLAEVNQQKNSAFDTYNKANAALLLDALDTAGLTPDERLKQLEPDAVAFKAAAQTYRAAVDAYDEAYTQHPTPRVSDFNC